MKLIIKVGTTSAVARVFIQDSSSTTGDGLTGLNYSSSGLKWSYIKLDQNTVTSVTLLTATLGIWTSGGFVEVDAVKFPGLYEIGIPNGALSSSSAVQMILFGATNMAPCPIEIELTEVDCQSPAFGLLLAKTTNITGFNDISDPWSTSLPGLYGSGTAGYIIGTNLDTTISSRSTYAGGAVASVTGNIGGNVVGSVASVTAGVTVTTNNDKTGYSLSVTPPTSSVIAAAVWDLSTSGHTTSGTFGAAMNAAGSAGDPWSTSLPGSYSAGSAGYIVGTNLDAKVSTRSVYSGGDTSGTTTLLSRLGSPVGASISADIQTRSTYSGADTSGTITLLSRIGSSLTINSGNVTVGTNNDKTGYALSSAGLDLVILEPAALTLPAVNMRQGMALILDTTAIGLIDGLPSSPYTVTNPAGTITRIVATFDVNTNRTRIETLNLP